MGQRCIVNLFVHLPANSFPSIIGMIFFHEKTRRVDSTISITTNEIENNDGTFFYIIRSLYIVCVSSNIVICLVSNEISFSARRVKGLTLFVRIAISVFPVTSVSFKNTLFALTALHLTWHCPRLLPTISNLVILHTFVFPGFVFSGKLLPHLLQ